MMSNEEFDEIMRSIELRKVYVDRYYKEFKSKPQWLKDKNSCDENPNFEEWMITEIRNEKLNQILNEKN
jgi:hypothetical protein